jgi:diguanylate cyclase (GGDEF)-like protein/PAS domain S-box-containing protein
MNLADVLIPPSLEAKQILRLRRFGVATLSYVLATVLVAIGWAFGVLPASTVLEVAAAFVAINLGLYAVIRAGFNLRFADPNLTRFQILAAITVLMYIVYHMDDGRSVALFGCFIVFLFGIVRLHSRDFTVLTLYTLAAYALVINLLMHLRPQAIHDVPGEWMSWLGLAGFLPCFTVIGGQLNALRRRMRASEARLRSLTEMSSDFHWESDVEHRLTDNSSADRTQGSVSVFQRGARIGERRWEIPSLSPDEAGWRAHRAVLDSHRPFRDFRLSRLGADGTERYISISGDPVLDDAGAFKGYRGVGTDVTERKRSEMALHESAQQLRLFADNIPAMTAYWDVNEYCRFANKAFAEFNGLAMENIVGRHAREILGEQAYHDIENHSAQMKQGHPVTFQRKSETPNGEFRYLEVRLLPHVGDQGKVLGSFAVTLDITEHKLAEQRIQRVAHHDNLTGLPNRLLFNDRLKQAVSLAKRDARQIALLYFDLDRFKAVNDTLGHIAGDELLKAVAMRVRDQVRESDTFARIGGDEFVVILPGSAAREGAETVARKIIAAIAAPFVLGGRTQGVDIGVSIGIAIYPADASDADGLVKAADAAMYVAKRTGNSFSLCA